jgi:hypothetical protein
MDPKSRTHSFADLFRTLFARPQILVRRRPQLPALEALEDRTVPTLLGNSLFPADNPWNQKITNAPVAVNSAQLVQSIGLTRSLHPDFGTTYAGALNGIPYNVVSGNQPKVNVVIDAYPDQSDLQPIPIPANAVIEGDPLPGDQNTSDRHLLVYDKDHNILYETFNTHRPSEEPDGQWHADSEAVWDLSRDSFRTPGFTSADAAGLPILPGLVRPDEVLDQGVITHALRFTVPRTQDAYVFPASHQAGTADPTLPRMGERFRLKQSFDISGFSPADRVILQALKDYGMIVADNGSPWYLSGAPSDRWSDDDLHQLTQVVGADFEAVDLTPIVSGISPNNGPAAGGTGVTITGLNFSGGAGLTQVYFGNTPAGSVQIVSDTEIIATAPAGTAGTMDVTVHSPYGVSSTGAADQFTYTSGSPGTGPASQFQVSGVPATATAGSSFRLTLTALDANGNLVTGYRGTVHFTATDAGATLPKDYTFTAADNGSHTFTGLVLVTAGNQTVKAADTANAGVSGSASALVSPAAASHFRLVAPAGVTAGTAFAATVTALDPYGNTATGYTGAVRFTSSDSRAVLPAFYRFTAGNAGVHTFTGLVLKTAAAQSLTVTDTARTTVTGRQTGIQVSPGAAWVLLLFGFPSTTTAGTPQTFWVLLRDAYGNTATGYTGTVRFGSSDPHALLPASYTFTKADKGRHTFTATLRTRGTQSLTATDTVSRTLGGSEMKISVR